MDRQQVLETIEITFPERPVPVPEIDPERVYPSDQVNTEKFRNVLAGKSWRELTTKFCTQHRFYFDHLQPAVYAYYLPALLTGSLHAETTASDRDPIHSTVFAINPSFESIARDGEDHRLRTHQTALTEAQYRAVCEFLGFAFAVGKRFDRFQAAHGLLWGWNRFETPALEAARAYREEMRSFVYPEAKDPEVAELCREIRAAFAATPYPGDNSLFDSAGEEPGEIAVGFRGVPWQSAHPQLLDCCSTALSFLPEAAMRYFLPAFLLADLLEKEMVDMWEYYGNADPAHWLTHYLYDTEVEWKAFDMRKFTTSRMRLFNRAERMAIIHYLEWRARRAYDRETIREALARYWRLSVTWGAIEEDTGKEL